MVRKALCSLIAVLVYQLHAGIDDYRYQPYPVLLVHGFNATPSTFGTYTEKEANRGDGAPKDNNIMSTKMIPNFGDKTNESFNREHAAWSLIKEMGAGGNEPLLNSGSKNYFYFNPSDVTGRLAELNRERYYPYEEPNSYTGLNHTYVETYCGYYAWESNDANGVRHSRFRGYDISESQDLTGYDITDGGQTQLLRIRLIQVLNEYYGDFKWVNDPSAKVNIVVHSNGGLVTTNMLQTDDNWYNDGKNKNGISWTEFLNGSSNGDPRKVIDGYGVKLRDHVNRVVTIDSPLSGSPLAQKDGSPCPWVRVWVMQLTGGLGYITTMLTGSGSILGPIINAAFLAVGYPLTDWIYNGAVNGSETPVMYDLATDGDFVNSLRDYNHAPQYTDGSEIPYTNFVSTCNATGTTFGAVGGVALAAGAISSIPGPNPLFNPYAAVIFSYLGTNLIVVSLWSFNSDMIVMTPSQDIRSLYPNASNRKRIDVSNEFADIFNGGMNRRDQSRFYRAAL